jgi:hypothetical protein
LFAEVTIPAAFNVTESTVTSKGVILVNYERAGAVPTGSPINISAWWWERCTEILKVATRLTALPVFVATLNDLIEAGGQSVSLEAVL